MTDFDAAEGPPSFDDPFGSGDVEQQIYAVVLQTRDPTTASAIADTIECDPKTARKYLDWFAELGIVTRREGHPVTYERNDSYFEWRRVNRLAADHSVEELQRRVRELSAKIDSYEREYGAPSPDEVDALAAVEADEDASIDDVYGDLGDWATARRERRQYERARKQRAGSTENERVSG
jgi:predicted transcriptional regulator